MNETTRNIFNRFFGINNDNNNNESTNCNSKVSTIDNECNHSHVEPVSTIDNECNHSQVEPVSTVGKSRYNYVNENQFDLTNAIPHCLVVLVLDTSHSMWGQGLTDMMTSVHAFCETIAKVQFQNAQVDIAAVSMGDNLGMLEDFTPLAASNLPRMKIRPKGDTPIGAALDLAREALEAQIKRYQASGISYVTPNLILLSDGKSTDDFQNAAAYLREAVSSGKLTCHAIALGAEADMASLAQIVGKNNIKIPNFGGMQQTFAQVGQMVSQTYEEEAQEVILDHAKSVNGHSGMVYLLDGSNILHWDEYRTGITLKFLLSITEHLKKNGQKFQVFFDASAPHIIRKNASGEIALYDKLLKEDPEHFLQVPAGTRADDFLLQQATMNTQALILTQDRFRDHTEKYPWLKTEKRVIPGMVMNNVIFFPEISLQISISAPEKSNMYYL